MTYLNIPTVRKASRKFCVKTGMTGTLASIAILAKPTRLKPINRYQEDSRGICGILLRNRLFHYACYEVPFPFYFVVTIRKLSFVYTSRSQSQQVSSFKIFSTRRNGTRSTTKCIKDRSKAWYLHKIVLQLYV